MASAPVRDRVHGMRRKCLFSFALVVLVSGCASEPRGPCTPNPPPGTVGAICGFHNPEDVEPIPPAGVLLVSQLRRGGSGGSLEALPLHPGAPEQARPRRVWPTGDPTRDRKPSGAPAGDPTCTEPPEADEFAPHGIASAATDTAAFLLCGFGRLPCRTGWSLFEIDPATMRATELLHHDGSVVGGVASAAEFDGTTFFGAVFDDRIGVWRPNG